MTFASSNLKVRRDGFAERLRGGACVDVEIDRFINIPLRLRQFLG